jgi:predicted GNAT family N-acyltransferase
MTSNYQVKEVKDYLEMIDCFEIRTIVFITEQKVSPEEEIDGRDKTAHHFLIYENKKAIGTLRLFTDESDKSFHIGRVAVLKEYRHQKAGYTLIQEVLKTIKATHPGYHVNIDAQVQAIGFYESLGFKVTDDKIFLDANIQHKHMSLVL